MAEKSCHHACRQQAQNEFYQFPALRFTGKVDDMRPFFNTSDVFISPFEEPHGSKLKIAEAMAMAMPIVSTPQGIRGFDLTHAQSVMLARNSQEFAAYCIELLNSSDQRERLGQAARQKALETIDWQVLGKKLRQIVEDTFATLATSQNATRNFK
ncbi:glycosyltransferase [Candidatus Chloroploca sp. Khr17]|uniref:glycosyltransferase n=1 Tax=Candidatus Chloroploca sp. Khr17 TaxID=2496869 RepID=UPI00101B7E7B|nr:glycosyltransferase [Candidatus Chloroploca sp. Khr17]